jgi:hypothetical protein
MQQMGYNDGNEVILRDPWWDVVSKGQSQFRVQFCTGGCEERTWAREAEESPLLEAVARERLMKIQQAGKRLASAMVICLQFRVMCISGQ